MKKNATLFKRKMYDRLLKWKKERNGKSAILIQGARRIGKSTLVEEFASNEYESYILIDFAIAPIEVQELFNDISDLNYISSVATHLSCTINRTQVCNHIR